ncbi:MAG: hypothetical protein KJ977_05290 [Candidatus Omnitrophica bacterium]|nr:hypothetical protein [Candidatus Omnitrophota bacterium]MBU2266437.1 hypothetical protein [Candidatus Omnitrophota bacterium]
MSQNKLQKTQTLLYVSFALLAVSVVAAVVMTSVITNLKTASYQQKGMDAYQLAMAGVERAKVELANSWGWPGMDDGGDDDPHLGEAGSDETESLGDGQYWVAIADNVDGTVTAISHGWVGDAHQVIEVIIEQVAGTVPVPEGVFVAERDRNRVSQLDENGDPVWSLEGAPMGAGQIAFNPNTNESWVFAGSQIVKLGANGIAEWSYQLAVGSGRLDVTVNPYTSEVWVANFDGDQVVKLNADGSLGWVVNFGSNSRPTSVAIVPETTPNTTQSWVSCSNSNRRLYKLNANGSVAWSLYRTDFRLYSVAVDPNTKDSWVAQYYNNRIGRVDNNGAMKSGWPKGGFNRPFAVSINPTTRECWVGEVRGHRIIKLNDNGTWAWNLNTGRDIGKISVDPNTNECWAVGANWVAKIIDNGTFGSFAFQNTSLSIPSLDVASIEVDPATGECWVNESGRSRVVRLDTNGNKVWQSPAFNAYALAGLDSGEVWVANYNSSAAYTGVVKANSVPSVDWMSDDIWAESRSIAVNFAGESWVADYNRDRVRKLRADGTIEWTKNLNNPISVAVNPNTNECWVAYNGNRVRKLNADSTNAWTRSGLNDPRSVSVNPNTNECWVAEYGGGRVRKLRADGTIEWGRNLSNPISVSVNPTTSESWVAEYGANRVRKLNADSTVAWTRGSLSGPVSVSVNPVTSQCWVSTVTGTARVIKLDTDGTVVVDKSGYSYPSAVSVPLVDTSATVNNSINVQSGSWRKP